MPQPVLVLTAAEWAALPWHARQKAINRQLRESRKPAPTNIETAESVIAWAEGERESARQALASLPIDPFASAHRRILMESLRRPA